MEAKETGTVKWFNENRGYGFITRDKGEDVFVHISSIVGWGYNTLNAGQRVEFSVEQSLKGLRATRVTRLD